MLPLAHHAGRVHHGGEADGIRSHVRRLRKGKHTLRHVPAAHLASRIHQRVVYANSTRRSPPPRGRTVVQHCLRFRPLPPASRHTPLSHTGCAEQGRRDIRRNSPKTDSINSKSAETAYAVKPSTAPWAIIVSPSAYVRQLRGGPMTDTRKGRAFPVQAERRACG